MILTSIDFETANHRHNSICAAGAAVFDDGELVDSRYWLVRPRKGSGWFLEEFTENCHGLNWFDVRDAPEFPAIALELLPCLARADVVIAHNAAFNILKLRATLEDYGLGCPEFPFLCTLKLSRRVWPGLSGYGLGQLAGHIGHAFEHHQAQEDAVAAGRVFLAMMKQAEAKTVGELLDRVGMVAEVFSMERGSRSDQSGI